MSDGMSGKISTFVISGWLDNREKRQADRLAVFSLCFVMEDIVFNR